MASLTLTTTTAAVLADGPPSVSLTFTVVGTDGTSTNTAVETDDTGAATVAVPEGTQSVTVTEVVASVNA